MKCTGALHFAVSNNTVIRFGVQTNSTSFTKREGFKFQIPLMLAADREIARSLIGGYIILICYMIYMHTHASTS